MTRSYHGDHLVEDDLLAMLTAWLGVDDGDVGPGGQRVQVSTIPLETTDRIALLSLPGTDVGPAPRDDALALLDTAVALAVPKGDVRCRQVVEVHGDLAIDPRGSSPNRGKLWRLLEVSWGEPAAWRPRTEHSGTLSVDPLLLVLTASSAATVPDLAAARAYLATTGHRPAGRCSRVDLPRPRLTRVADWSERSSEAWLVGGLLDALLDNASEDGEPGIRVARLAPGGAPIALVEPFSGVLDYALGASVLTVWEGVDQEGDVVAVTALKSGFVNVRERRLPIWEVPDAQSEPDLWAGSPVTVIDHDEESDYESAETRTSRCRLALTELGRQSFPSQRLVASDPCMASAATALDLTLASAGPFPVYLAQLQEEFEGGFVNGEDKGILVRLNEMSAPVHWVPAQDGSGVYGGSIESGELGMFDQGAGAWVEEERLSSSFGLTAPVALVRSRPHAPADVCVIRSLGGDGPFWSALGLSADGTPVAVFTGNFDLLKLLT